MAQWKRAGLITLMSSDRNRAALSLFFRKLLGVLLEIFFGEHKNILRFQYYNLPCLHFFAYTKGAVDLFIIVLHSS